jgi:hypothetical protein
MEGGIIVIVVFDKVVFDSTFSVYLAGFWEDIDIKVFSTIKRPIMITAVFRNINFMIV